MGGNQNSSSEYDSDIDSDIIADGGAACFYGDDELKAELEQLGFVESTNRKALKQADAAIAERRTLEEALANHTKRNNAAIEALAELDKRDQAQRLADEQAKLHNPTRPVPNYTTNEDSAKAHPPSVRKKLHAAQKATPTEKENALDTFNRAIENLQLTDNNDKNKNFHSQLYGILSLLREPFNAENESPELLHIMREFAGLAINFKEHPQQAPTTLQNMIKHYDDLNKTKLTVHLKSTLATVIGAAIGAVIGFCIGVCIGGIGSIPFTCAGAAIGCVIGGGLSGGISFTLFSKNIEFQGRENDASRKRKSELSNTLHLRETLANINNLPKPRA